MISNHKINFRMAAIMSATALSALGFGSASASAAVVQAVFTGTITVGNSTTFTRDYLTDTYTSEDNFDTPLIGTGITLSFVYDTENGYWGGGTYDSGNGYNSTYESAYGAIRSFAFSPLAINFRPAEFTTDAYIYQYTNNTVITNPDYGTSHSSYTTELQDRKSSEDGDTYTFSGYDILVYLSDEGLRIPGSLTAPFSFAPQEDADFWSRYGQISSWSQTNVYLEDDLIFSESIDTWLRFQIDGLTISAYDPEPLAAVPLPAAGWLLVAALGGLGVMGRRRG